MCKYTLAYLCMCISDANQSSMMSVHQILFVQFFSWKCGVCFASGFIKCCDPQIWSDSFQDNVQ